MPTHNASVYGLQNEKTLIFNGLANAGKSEFVHALCREITMRKDKEAYGCGNIDKYGAVTKANQMSAMGCFMFDDFTLSTRGGTHRLGVEEIKQFLYE